MKNRRIRHASLALLLIVPSACAEENPAMNGQPATQGIAGMSTTPVPTSGTGGTITGAAGTPGTAGMTVASAGRSGGAGMSGAAGTPAAGGPAPMAGTGAMAGAEAMGGAGGSVSAAGKLPKVTTTDGPGPFAEVVKVKSTPPGGWMIYPKDIGKDGIKHPLFLFGPGGGTTPMTYETSGMHWDRYASYGFVIYVLPMSTGDGSAMKAGLDWLIAQNDDAQSPLYQHLDTTKVCAAGHSMGSVTTFDFMPDDRVTTTIHISGGSFDGMGPSHLSKDTMFLCGPNGSADVAFPQCEGDFANSKVPTFYTNIQGSDHLTSGRLGWAAIIAWMLWHLADHEEWKKEFLEPTGQFQTGIYKSQIKNW